MGQREGRPLGQCPTVRVSLTGIRSSAAELAQHFAQSSDPLDLGKAVHYGEVAAQRAVSVYAYGEAVRHLETALQAQEVLDPDDKLKRCDLLLALGEALMPAGEPKRTAEEIAPRAFELAEALDDHVRILRSCRMAVEGLGRASTVAYATPEFRMWADRADQHAPADGPERARAELAISYALEWTGHPNEANQRLDAALAAARKAGDADVLFDVLQLCIRNWNTIDLEEDALRLVEEFAGHSRAGISARTEARFLWGSSFTLLAFGRREAAETLWRQIDELAGRVNDASVQLYPLFGEWATHILDGELEAAAATGASFATRAEQLGVPAFGRGNAALTSYRPLLLLGRSDEVPNLPSGARQSALRESLKLAHLGRLDEARDALQRAVEQRFPLLTNLVCETVETAILTGDHGITADWAGKLSQVKSSFSSAVADLSCIARHLGAAAALLGDPAQAEAYYRQALEVCGKIRFRPEIALTRLQLAELLLDHDPDRAVEAQGHLDFAVAEFRAMKMTPSLERALRRKGLLGA